MCVLYIKIAGIQGYNYSTHSSVSDYVILIEPYNDEYCHDVPLVLRTSSLFLLFIVFFLRLRFRFVSKSSLEKLKALVKEMDLRGVCQTL